MMRTILKNSRARLFVSVALASTMFITLAGCNASEPAAGANGEVNIYSARHYDADEQLYDLFEKNTGIAINRIEMKGDLLLERLKAEGTQSPADVILLVDAGNFWRAESAGLFQSVQSAKLDATVPTNLQGPKKDWFGFAKRARVIAYDPVRIKAAYHVTYAQFADPALKGKVLSSIPILRC